MDPGVSRLSEVAFTESVRRAQQSRGVREFIEARIDHRDRPADLTPELQRFVASRDSFYLATASLDGRPYVQHRGGPPGFLRSVDSRTLVFPDYRGNKQYISVGNLSENPRVMLFLMDYPNRQRLKIWGRAEIVEGSPQPQVERTLSVRIEAWDLNCPKHIGSHHRPVAPALRLVHLEVCDSASYERYRVEMRPILASYGGEFVLDLQGDMEGAEVDFELNRTLLIRFPDSRRAEAFYADPAYRQVRARWFEPAVRNAHAAWVSGAAAVRGRRGPKR